MCPITPGAGPDLPVAFTTWNGSPREWEGPLAWHLATSAVLLMLLPFDYTTASSSFSCTWVCLPACPSCHSEKKNRAPGRASQWLPGGTASSICASEALASSSDLQFGDHCLKGSKAHTCWHLQFSSKRSCCAYHSASYRKLGGVTHPLQIQVMPFCTKHLGGKSGSKYDGIAAGRSKAFFHSD